MEFLKEISHEELVFHEKCGGGSYGSVYRATWTTHSVQVAVKKLLSLDKEVCLSYQLMQIISFSF